MSDIDPLPPDIEALLEGERAATAADPALKAAVLARVERTIALTAPAPGHGGESPPKPDVQAAVDAAKRAIWTKLLAVGVSAFVAGGVVGGAVVKGTTDPVAVAPSVATMEAPLASTVTTVVPSAVTSAQIPSPTVTVSASAAPAVATVDAAAPLPTTGRNDGDLVRERELLDAARAALAKGNSDDAIASLKTHEAKWPHGFLAEEREVVWIQALVSSNRRDEAEQRAAMFRRSYPKSMLMPAVDVALQK